MPPVTAPLAAPPALTTQEASRVARRSAYVQALRRIEAELVRCHQARHEGVWFQEMIAGEVEMFCSQGSLKMDARVCAEWLRTVATPPSLEAGEQVLWEGLMALEGVVVLGRRGLPAPVRGCRGRGKHRER